MHTPYIHEQSMTHIFPGLDMQTAVESHAHWQSDSQGETAPLARLSRRRLCARTKYYAARQTKN